MFINFDNAREQARANADSSFESMGEATRLRIAEMLKTAIENDRVLVEKASDFLAELHLTRSDRIAQSTEQKIQKAQSTQQDGL